MLLISYFWFLAKPNWPSTLYYVQVVKGLHFQTHF